MSERITCNGCDHTWTALGAAHCTGCHRPPFATARLFDLHRSQYGEHGRCLDPETIINSRTGERLMYLRDGMFKGPEMDEEVKALRRGAA